MNVQPGDLAVIIATGLAETEANIGAIVEVLHRYPFDMLAHRRVSWVVRSTGRRLLGYKGPPDTLGAEEEIGVFDSHLRKLRPEEEPVKVETAQPAEVAA